jgi:hypothetical protein
MRHLLLLPALFLATPAFADQLTCDGPFAADSSEQKLIEAFGKDNVVTGEVPGPEGSTVLATTIFPNDDTKRIEVGWWDEENLSQLAYFTVPSGDVSPQGVKTGMTVKEVEALNGAPFEMQGFWWGLRRLRQFHRWQARRGRGRMHRLGPLRPQGRLSERSRRHLDFRRSTGTLERAAAGAARCPRPNPVGQLPGFRRLRRLTARRPRRIQMLRWFPGPAWARGSKGNTVRRTHQGPNP